MSRSIETFERRTSLGAVKNFSINSETKDIINKAEKRTTDWSELGNAFPVASLNTIKRSTVENRNTETRCDFVIDKPFPTVRVSGRHNNITYKPILRPLTEHGGWSRMKRQRSPR
jgi:hypothetical protein